MALDRQVRMLLKSSADKARIYGPGQGTKDLTQAYKLVERTLRSRGSFEYHKSEVLTPEAFLLCAEVAIMNENYKIAHVGAENFFLTDPPKDQFYCRGLFVRALVRAFNARDINGMPAVEKVKHCLTYLLEAISISLGPEKRPRYDFLVYNASVHFWRITRRMMRAQARHHFVQEMQTVVDALKTVNNSDKAWRCQYLISLALCYEGLYVSCVYENMCSHQTRVCRHTCALIYAVSVANIMLVLAYNGTLTHTYQLPMLQMQKRRARLLCALKLL